MEFTKGPSKAAKVIVFCAVDCKVVILKLSLHAIFHCFLAILQRNASFVKSQIYLVVSVLTIVLCFVPAVIVLLKKLWQATPFQFFAIYWIINGLVYSILRIKGIDKQIIEVIIVTYNALDIPMTASIVYFSASSSRLKKFIRLILGLFIVFEIGCLVQGGFRYEALKYVLGVGLLFMLTIIIWQISLFLQQVSHVTREKALLLIHGGFLFQYGTYIVVYVFDYFIVDVADNIDKFLIYYISTIISISIGSSGLLLNGLHKLPATAAFRKSFWAGSQDKPAG